MSATHRSFDPAALDIALWDQMAVAITVLDLNGVILFYNDHAPRILDRKPEYLGRDVCELHNPASTAKIRAMLEAYKNGEAKEFVWRLARNGQEFVIRLTPLMRDGRIAGAVHIAMVLP
jgi:PAS domain S-box-containing protein